MKTQRFAAALVLALGMVSTLPAADHLDAPNLAGNGQVDINDLYAFQSPSNPDNTVLIMTVNPGAGLLSPTTFGADVTYSFNIDNTGDAVADLTYDATFGALSGGSQSFSVLRSGSAYASGSTGGSVVTSAGGQVQAGLFDDPFFFDLNGFNDGFNFTGDNFFEGLNVSAIVLEVPSSELGGPNIGVWASTSQGGMQVDRMGRPAINTALIPSARKQEFNEAAPAGDFATFGGDVNATIQALSGMANADALTPILLPDVLTIDVSDSSGFLNGRRLDDDVIDAELGLLSEGAVTGDGVSVDAEPFLATQQAFPYLAPANAIPEPSTLLLMVLSATAGLTSRRRVSG